MTTTSVTSSNSSSDMMPQPPASIVKEGWLHKRGKLNVKFYV